MTVLEGENMKNLLNRIEKLESALKQVKPVMIVRSHEDEAKARQQYERDNGYMPEKVIQIVRAAHEH